MDKPMTPADRQLPDMPGEWEEYTIRVKKDPEWQYHGSDIEFNGVRYTRAPDTALQQELEELRLVAEGMAEALREYTNVVATVWDPNEWSNTVKDEGVHAREALAAYEKFKEGKV